MGRIPPLLWAASALYWHLAVRPPPGRQESQGSPKLRLGLPAGNGPRGPYQTLSRSGTALAITKPAWACLSERLITLKLQTNSPWGCSGLPVGPFQYRLIHRGAGLGPLGSEIATERVSETEDPDPQF